MDAISRRAVINPYADAMRQSPIGPLPPTPDTPAEPAEVSDLVTVSAPLATDRPGDSARTGDGRSPLARVMRGVALAATFGAVALGTTGCAITPSVSSYCMGSECRPYVTSPMIPMPIPVPLPHGDGIHYHFPAPYHGIPGGPHQGLNGGRYSYPGGPNPGWHR